MNNFAKTTRWLLITNKRYYVKMAVASTLAYFLLMTVNTGLLSLYRHPVTVEDAVNAVPGICLAYICISGIVAASVASDLKTKQQRSLYIMLPASGNDKFWGRILLATVWGYVVSAIAVCVADVLQMLVSWIFSGTAASMAAAICKSLNLSDIFLGCYGACSPATNVILKILLLLSTAAWGFSAYILGGFLFRKVPFIMTTISWIVFWVTAGSVGTLFLYCLTSSYDNVSIDFWWNKEITLSVAAITVCLLFTAFNLWMSHRIHKRMTVIGHRFFNI